MYYPLLFALKRSYDEKQQQEEKDIFERFATSDYDGEMIGRLQRGIEELLVNSNQHTQRRCLDFLTVFYYLKESVDDGHLQGQPNHHQPHH